MESLNQTDWKTLQQVFFPRARNSRKPSPNGGVISSQITPEGRSARVLDAQDLNPNELSRAIYAWVDWETSLGPLSVSPNHEKANRKSKQRELPRGTVVCALVEGEDTSEWVGAPVSELSEKLPDRDLVLLDAQLGGEQWEALVTSNGGADAREPLSLLDQRKAWLQGARALVYRRGTRSFGQELKRTPTMGHFLIDAVVSKAFSRWLFNYSVWIRVLPETPDEPFDFLFQVKEGRLASLCRPELQSMSEERRQEPTEVVKAISEKYWTKTQGVVFTSEAWEACQKAALPWREVRKGLQNRAIRLVPFRPWLWAWAWLRGLLLF
jgi:hypothetical protein